MTALTLELPEDDEWGPAMAALTPRERAFVYLLVECGGNRKQAAKAAGYGTIGTPEQQDAAQRTAASRLSRSEKVQAAITEEAEKRLKGGGLLAAEALEAMVLDPTGKNHFKAVAAMLDRAGLVVTQKQEITVRREHLTDKELDARIEQLTASLAKAGLLPAPIHKLTTDATFEPAPSMAGLEDLFG